MRFADIVKWWEMFADRPIVDKTGLTGSYDFELDFARETARESGADAAIPKAGFRDAVERQLGLRLESAKGQVDVLVVDRFNRTPTAN